jgi:hypothetical protein
MYWIGENGRRKVCREDRNSRNAEIDRWLRAIVTVTQDLFSGKQHSLRR